MWQGTDIQNNGSVVNSTGETQWVKYLWPEMFIEKDFENGKFNYFDVSLTEEKQPNKRNTEQKICIFLLHKIIHC